MNVKPLNIFFSSILILGIAFRYSLILSASFVSYAILVLVTLSFVAKRECQNKSLLLVVTANENGQRAVTTIRDAVTAR